MSYHQATGDSTLDFLATIGGAAKDAAAGAISMFGNGGTPTTKGGAPLVVMPTLDVRGPGYGARASAAAAMPKTCLGLPCWAIPAAGALLLVFALTRKSKRRRNPTGRRRVRKLSAAVKKKIAKHVRLTKIRALHRERHGHHDAFLALERAIRR